MASIEMQTVASHPANFPRHLATVGPQPLTQEQREAIQPLENAIGYLGANRETLEGLRAQHSRNSYRPGTNDYGNLHDMYFKRGTAAHHRNLAKDMKTTNRFTHSITSTTPLKDIANTHEAIANRIDEVKAAHVALSANKSHPTLASKDGSMGKKNRKYLSPSGVTQSLGNYHGKNITEDGTPKTFEKGGRKPRKRKRKTKRKTRKRKRKTKRKTRRKRRKRRKTKRKRRGGNGSTGITVEECKRKCDQDAAGSTVPQAPRPNWRTRLVPAGSGGPVVVAQRKRTVAEERRAEALHGLV